jgi:hypothetical protein
MNGTPVFNNPVESALRSLVLLAEAYPATLDLQKLVYLDYLLVHSADAGGPASLHPPTPQRDGEVAVRRELIEQGLHLLLVRGLAERRATTNGFDYAALDAAGTVIASLETEYSQQLRARAAWVATTFAQQDINALNAFFHEHIGRWGEEFTLTSPGWEDVT